MAFFNLGTQEILVLLALGAGGSANDLAAWLEPVDYFKSRGIEVDLKKMTTLAGAEPATAKASLQQLLALHWLGEHGKEVKNDRATLDLLQQIAQGKKAQDSVGFARDYAQRALAMIEGKPLPPPSVPDNSLREEGAKWFPEACSFYGGLDARAPGPFLPSQAAEIRRTLSRLFPEREKEAIYQFAETVGNLRIERFSGAYLPDDKDREKSRIFLRLTGRGDHKRLAQFIQNRMGGGATAKEEKGPKGETITRISAANEPPALALIGNTDLLLAGYVGRPDNHSLVLQEALDARVGRKPNLTSGPLTAQLKRSPAQAAVLLLGKLPDGLREELTRGGSPLGAVPQTVYLALTRGKEASVRFEAKMAKAEEAKAMVEGVNKLKQQALQGLNQVPPELKIKKEALDLFRKTVEGIKVEADDTTVKGSVQIGADVFRALQDLIEQAANAQKQTSTPPAQPKVPKKSAA